MPCYGLYWLRLTAVEIVRNVIADPLPPGINLVTASGLPQQLDKAPALGVQGYSSSGHSDVSQHLNGLVPGYNYSASRDGSQDGVPAVAFPVTSAGAVAAVLDGQQLAVEPPSASPAPLLATDAAAVDAAGRSVTPSPSTAPPTEQQLPPVGPGYAIAADVKQEPESPAGADAASPKAASSPQVKLPPLSPLPRPDPSDPPEVHAEYDYYMQRWQNGDTLAQRWHRLKEKGKWDEIRDDWEEWQQDIMLMQLQQQIAAANKGKKRAKEDSEPDLDAPRQVGNLITNTVNCCKQHSLAATVVRCLHQCASAAWLSYAPQSCRRRYAKDSPVLTVGVAAVSWQTRNRRAPATLQDYQVEAPAPSGPASREETPVLGSKPRLGGGGRADAGSEDGSYSDGQEQEHLQRPRAQLQQQTQPQQRRAAAAGGPGSRGAYRPPPPVIQQRPPQQRPPMHHPGQQMHQQWGRYGQQQQVGMMAGMGHGADIQHQLYQMGTLMGQALHQAGGPAGGQAAHMAAALEQFARMYGNDPALFAQQMAAFHQQQQAHH